MITKTRQNVAETFRKDLNDFSKLWKGLMTGENSPSAKTVDKLVKIMNDFKVLKK